MYISILSCTSAECNHKLAFFGCTHKKRQSFGPPSGKNAGVFAIGGKGEISEVRQTAERSCFGSRASEVALNINSLYTVDIEKST